MGNRASIIFLNETQTKEYIENPKDFTLKAGSNYIYTHWNGGIESVCSFVDFARFLRINELEINKKYIEFYAMLRNFFLGIDSHCKYGIFEKYGNRSCTLELEKLDDNANVNEVLFFDNKPCVISDKFEIISYTSEEIEEARKDKKYQEIFNGLKKQYAKIETNICESVIDGKKLANELGCVGEYAFFFWNKVGLLEILKIDKINLAIMEVSYVQDMLEFYDNCVEYNKLYTREKVDLVCKMLKSMIEFCEKRQIKYINLN